MACEHYIPQPLTSSVLCLCNLTFPRLYICKIQVLRFSPPLPDSLTKMRSGHSISDEDTDTEELAVQAEVAQPPKTEKENEKKLSVSGSQSTPLRKGKTVF